MDNLELNCRWHFAKQLGGREDGPNDPMQDNFKKTPYASLIRESIQNSLDVPLDTTMPVRMEFSINRIRAHEYSNFFHLKKHIKGCIKHFKGNGDAITTYQPMLDYLNSLGPYDNLYYIKVSDYNTIGMSYIKGDTSQPFYAFVRAAGVSSKSDKTAGGSFGYGKAAYFYISPIRTVLVSTKTKDNRCFFEGVASLCTHEFDCEDDLRVSVGYYDNNNGEPISSMSDIPKKFQRNETGTDIFILGIDASNKNEIYQEMIEAVLRNFWLSIENKKLEVQVNDIIITYDTIAELMDEYFPNELDNTARREKNYNPRPYWSLIRNGNSNPHYFFYDEILPTVGHVYFHAIKNKNAIDKILYMRKPRMLVKARRTQGSNGFYGVFVCDDIYGNEYLRKTENPPHNEWESSNWRENGKIVPKGREAIDDVEKFIIKAIGLLFPNKGNGTQQIPGLEEYLYIPTAVEDDEDSEQESLVGDAVTQQDEGNQLSTELSNPGQNTISQNTSIGKIIITDPVTDQQKRDIKGGLLSGKGTNKRKNKGGGGPSVGKLIEHVSPSDEGMTGTALTEVAVHYRVFAQSENGQIIHTIVIHSDYDIPNGRIDLMIGGEQSDEVVKIIQCSQECNINDNSLSGLTIQKGKNILKIKFADNMKHAVKLDAYELK